MTSFISSLKTAFTGYLKYRGSGHLAFILHRVTGLGTLLFLTVHIVDTSFAYFSPELYEHAVVLYRLPLFMIGEIGLVFCVIYHGINGLRVAYVDMFKPTAWTISKQNRASMMTLAVSVVLWLPAAWIMFSNLLAHL